MNPLQKNLLRTAVCAAVAIGAAARWPTKTIRIIVPYPAGGFTDQMARIVQAGLQERLQQSVIVDNKPGANSIIGVDALAKAPGDGSTFGVVIPAFTANTSLYAKLPYDPRRDFAPVSLLGVTPLIATVNNDAPFKTAQELIAYARQNPGKVTYGSSGNGSAVHLTGELLKLLTNTYMVHIPYRGEVPALTDLIGGQIQLLFGGGAGLINQGKAGKVRMIGVASERRLAAIPEVPTFVEQGLPGFVSSSWAGILAPAATPKELIRRISDEAARIMRSDETRVRLDAMGTFAAGSTPEEFEAFIASETTKWAKVINRAHVKPD